MVVRVRSADMAWLVAELSGSPSAHDQRGANRRKLRLELQALGSRGDRVLVMDLSVAGLMIHTQADLSVDEIIQVQLPEAGETEARVAWKRQSLYGCEFLQPIAKAAVSAALLKARPDRPSPAGDLRDPDIQT